MRQFRKYKLKLIAFVIIIFLNIVTSVFANDLSIKSSYRFDGLITHGWEHDFTSKTILNPAVTLIVKGNFLDATQDSIAGIVKLRGQIISAVTGLEFRACQNRIAIDFNGGIDNIIGWQVKPRGAIKFGLVAPIPYNRFIQNLKLTPEAWYTHSMFNGPAIQNRIASYGFSSELGLSMGPKVAASVNYRQEYLRPACTILSPEFTKIGNDTIFDPVVDTDSLDNNIKRSFYGYLYKQVFKSLYLGYAFSYATSLYDRKVLTNHELLKRTINAGPMNFDELYGSLYGWAHYPYPTPIDMTAHIISIATNVPITSNLNSLLNLALPIYSYQLLRYPMNYWEYAWGGENTPPMYDRNSYEFEKEKNTGPLVIRADITAISLFKLKVTLSYDYFGFPYKEWAYFTKDSYSLHTFSTSLSKQF